MSHLAHTVRRSLPAWLAACALLVALAAFALVWIGQAGADEGTPSSPDAVSKTVSTVTSKADAIDATDSQCTRSTSFINMPNTGLTFKLGGNSPRSVLVLFQGEWFVVDGSSEARIRLLIDGVVQSGPNAVRAAEGGDRSTRGFNFVSDPLAPGQHFAFIQWMNTGVPGREICIIDRNLIVLHK